jgi:3-oxoacyl-[acyl-carrier-protein] synthase-3
MARYGSKIISVGYYVPDKIVKSKDLEKKLRFKENLGVPYGILERLTGCKEHREAPPDTDASDLAVWASEKAIKHAGISANDIDLLIFSACCQDITEPATANIVQEKLNAKNAQVFDVKNACNAFINSVDIADSMISSEKAKTVLVTTGEVGSKYIDYNIKKREDLDLKASGLTIGDGGAAVMMTKSNPGENGIRASHFTSDGSQWRLAVIYGGGTMYPRDPNQCYFLSDSVKIIDLAFERIPPIMLKVIKQAGWQPKDVDMVIPHQVTIKIIKDIMDKVGIPFERAIITVDRYGNTASSTIPIALGIALDEGRLKQGMKVLFVGGASGFTVGVIALVW